MAIVSLLITILIEDRLLDAESVVFPTIVPINELSPDISQLLQPVARKTSNASKAIFPLAYCFFYRMNFGNSIRSYMPNINT